jgi:sugar transferase (PEP-CTERM system associated)
MATLFRQRVTWRLVTLFVFETALIVLTVVVAAALRLGASVALLDGRESLFFKGLLIALVTQLCLYYADLYKLEVVVDRRELFIRTLQALGATALILGVLYFWFPALVIGRGVFTIAAAFVITVVIGWRVAFEWLAKRVGPRERLLLVGTSAAAVGLARELYLRTELGIEIVGFVDSDPALVGSPVINPGVIGTIEDIPDIIQRRSVDRVVVSLADARGKLPMEKLLEMRLGGVTFDHLASVYEEYTGKIAVENLRPSWLIFSSGFKKGRLLVASKRLVDVIVSLLGLMVSLPLLGLLALAVKITSAGPALYHQQRVGQHGRLFVVHKLRSMRVDAEARSGAVWATAADDRATPLGRFLRRTRFDELPQLWNILVGDMSLVGPRPERPEFVQALTREIPFYGQRHVVKPGLTGWAQVRYTYGASVEDAMEKLQYDLFYIKNASIAFDLFIIFKTVQTVVLRRGV